MNALTLAELVLAVMILALLVAFTWRARRPHAPTVAPVPPERREPTKDQLAQLDRLTDRLELAVRAREQRGR